MSRKPRIDVPGGTYYLLQVTNRHTALFTHASDYAHLQSLLASTVQRTRTKVFAYCWLPHELHLVIRTSDITLGRFMQGFTSCYARYVHAHTHDRGHLFSQRFHSLLIDPKAWLPALARYVHHAPVRANQVSSPQDYPHSSHCAYAGIDPPAWLHLEAVRKVLRNQGITTYEKQLAYLTTEPTADEVEVFNNDASRHMRILGDAEFSQQLPRPHRPSTRGMTLTQLVDAIAVSQNVTKEEMLSLSRRRPTALARALLAWHAMERRVASLAEVAHLLRRDSSTLSKAIVRHRERRPELFRLDALTHLRSLGM